MFALPADGNTHACGGGTTKEQSKPAPAPPVQLTIDIATHPEGIYVLNGVMDVNSSMVLEGDGTFRVGIMLGAADSLVTGRWVKQGDTIILQRTSYNQLRRTQGGADNLSPLFDHMQLTIDGPCLRTSLMGASACYLRR